MLPWMQRHPVLAWSVAWGLTGIALSVAEVLSKPQLGPLWVAVVVGAIAWGGAGAATFPARRALSALVWALAYLTGLWLAAYLRSWMDANDIAPGFIGMLVGWASAGVVGALAALGVGSHVRFGRAIASAVVWGLAFFLGAYAALVAAMILGQFAIPILRAVLGLRAAWLIGWGMGCALGGAIAATIAVGATRRLVGPQPTTPEQLEPAPRAYGRFFS